VKKRIHQYYYQLTHGCGKDEFCLICINFELIGNSQCSNIYCRSSSAFKYDEKMFLEDRNKVAAEALQLFSKQAQICVHEDEIKIKNFTENNLLELINQCKETNNWNLLKDSIRLIFSNRLNLSTSFLKKDFSENISVHQVSSPTASATPKSRRKK
jgi:hypothetical protein